MADGFSPNSSTAHQPLATVVIADGHDISRAGLRSLLDRFEGVRVTGEATDGPAAVRLCSVERPRLIVLDTALAGADGGSLISQLRLASPGSAIVAVSGEPGPRAVVAAIQAGARAFLLRDSPAGVLAVALERVLAGEAFVDPTLAGQVVEAFALRPGQAAVAVPEPLTPRELEVLRSIAGGRSNKEIAFDLHVATGTVKVHVERILRKLGVANRAEATMHAVRLGILDPEEEAPAQLLSRYSKPH